MSLSSPKIRFKDDNGNDFPAWEEKGIGDSIEMLSGFPFPSEEILDGKSTSERPRVLLMRGVNITEGSIRHSPDQDRFYCGDVAKLKKYLLEVGDMVIGMDGSKVGKNSAIVGEAEAGSLLVQRVARIRPIAGVSLRYIYQHINSFVFHRYVDRVKTSSGIPHISAKQIREFKIGFPCLIEQKKIADFLTSVDDRIGQLIKKKALLEDYKKGVMQQLFSQQIRFKDDNGNDFPNWEEKKLGEITKCFSGGTPSSGKRDFYGGAIPFIRSAEIAAPKTALFLTKEGYDSSAAKMVEEGDLLVALYGANSGEVGIARISGAINQAILCVRSMQEVSFLFFWLEYSKDSIVKTYLQGGQGNLSGKIVQSLKIDLPLIPEQKKIADFLTSVDRKIESVSQQITKTQTFKKGLLQQMFV